MVEFSAQKPEIKFGGFKDCFLSTFEAIKCNILLAWDERLISFKGLVIGA